MPGCEQVLSVQALATLPHPPACVPDQKYICGVFVLTLLPSRSECWDPRLGNFRFPVSADKRSQQSISFS